MAGENMRNVFAALVVLSTLSGCVALQQMSQSAANNAKPASAPVLTEHPSSSALWKDAPTTFHVGARSFALNVTSDLFNTVSVKLGGRQAVELPRGSFTDYRPIDRSQLAHGKVYFRLLSQSSDGNRQTELDLLEIVDKDNAFIDAVPVVSTIDLVVGETSSNPAYNGTPNSYKEGTWQVVLDRKEIGPPGSGGTSQCAFDLESTDPVAGADLGRRAPATRLVRWPARSVPHVLRMHSIGRVDRRPSPSAPLVALLSSRAPSPMGPSLPAPGLMRPRSRRTPIPPAPCRRASPRAST